MFTVASYNLLYASGTVDATPTWKRWVNRRTAARDSILRSGAALVGLQEVSWVADPGASIAVDLAAMLTASTGNTWKVIPGSRYLGVIYDSSKLAGPDAMITTDVNIQYVRPGQQRVMMYGAFTELSTGRSFMFVNTHFENGNTADKANMRAESSNIVSDYVRNWRLGLPVLITGDFNKASSGSNDPYGIFQSNNIYNARTLSTNVGNDVYNSYNGFDTKLTNKQSGLWIDGVLVTNGDWNVYGSGLDMKFVAGTIPPLATPIGSDHSLVHAQVEMRPKPTATTIDAQPTRPIDDLFQTNDFIERHQYSYFLTDLRDNKVLAEVSFQDVTYSTRLSEPGEFQGSIMINDETAVYDLRNNTSEGKTGLYVLRDSQPVWGGIIWKRKYNDGRKLTINAQTFESYLEQRLYAGNAIKKFTNTDQLVIARWLLEQAEVTTQIQADVSTRTSTRKRDRTFNAFEFKTIMDNMTRLGNLIDGFDWNVEIYRDPGNGQIKRLFQFYYPERGVPADKSQLYFEFPGSIRTFETSGDATAGANIMWTIGNGEGIDQLYAQAQIDSQITAKWPKIEKSRSYKSVLLQPTLQEHAEKDLERLATPVTIFEVTVSADVDPALGSYSVGDWARFRIEDQFLTPMIDQYARITGIDVTIDNGTGLEQVKLTLGGREVTTEDETQ